MVKFCRLEDKSDYITAARGWCLYRAGFVRDLIFHQGFGEGAHHSCLVGVIRHPVGACVTSVKVDWWFEVEQPYIGHLLTWLSSLLLFPSPRTLAGDDDRSSNPLPTILFLMLFHCLSLHCVDYLSPCFLSHLILCFAWMRDL